VARISATTTSSKVVNNLMVAQPRKNFHSFKENKFSLIYSQGLETCIMLILPTSSHSTLISFSIYYKVFQLVFFFQNTVLYDFKWCYVISLSIAKFIEDEFMSMER
jgi:hypothetical protein